MPICNVTGVIYLPSGEPIGQAVVTFLPVETAIKNWVVGAVTPKPVTTRSTDDGSIDVDLITGAYRINVHDWFGWANVPDATSASVAEILSAAPTVDPPPEWVVDMRADISAAAKTAEWDGIADKPSTFPPSSHMHQISDITGLAASLTAADAEVAERRAIVRAASVAGYAVVAMDATGHATWLAARDSDGAPPDWVIDHLVDRMEAPLGVAGVVSGLAAEVSARTGIARLGSAPGLAIAVIDPQERLTWLAASAADGGMPGWVAEHVAERVSPYLSLSDASILPTDRALVGGAVAPILPDMTRMAGWGSSTMEYMGAEIAAEMGGLGVSYYNGGDAGVLASHTLAQMGARPALLTVVGGQIPASGPVSVTASNMTASNQMRTFAGTLAGVHGSLSSTQTELTFTRSAGGEVVAVSSDTPFLPTVGPQYRDAINLLNIGKNDIYNVDLAPLVVAKTAEAFAYSRPFFRRNVVVGHFVNRDSPDVSPIRTRVIEINASYAAQYGPLYFDLQAYVTGQQVWVDAGLTPTADDLSHQLRGNKPPSLSLDDGHLNAAGDSAVAKALRRFVVNLGWYKENSA